MQNCEGLPGDQKDCTKILGNKQIARKHPQLPQNRHPFATGQGSECNPPKTVAMPAQSFAILGIVAKLHIPGDPIASRSKPPQRPTDCNRPNQHNQTGSQSDCRTTKDCNAIDMIALRLHVLQVDCGNCTSHRGIKTSNPSNLLQSGSHAPVQMQDLLQDHNVQANLT